jgi:hypothetical protein
MHLTSRPDNVARLPICAAVILLSGAIPVPAQTATQASATTATTATTTATTTETGSAAARQQEIASLRAEVARISARLDAVQAEGAPSEGAAGPAGSAAAGTGTQAQMAAGTGLGATAGIATGTAAGTATGTAANTPAGTAQAQPAQSDAQAQAESLLAGTTFNVALDGYYSYNFDHPIGRVNLLRAYTVSSNSFTVSQADFIVEHLPQPLPGRRFGGRIDLQFGQATETLQGSSANELRPQVWRNLYQAYGSYLAPIGSGVQIDFGKWASALGVEGNYNKDQINYSRSFLFNYLPFYHTGFRANYNLTPKLNVAYWVVNGAQQSEDFNGSKSQAIITTIKPTAKLTWNVNYYFGAEGRDVVTTLNPGLPSEPTQPGLPTANVSPVPNGREHIFNTYATYTPTAKLTLAYEGDYVVDRTFSHSSPGHVAAGALYVRYALPRDWAVASRTEYFDDRSGLFSGTSQSLKEFTFSLDKQLEPGLLTRFEYRRDFSNQPFFLTSQTGVLDHAQPTATLGLVYWLGQKQGAW